jgi:hypothetical protein
LFALVEGRETGGSLRAFHPVVARGQCRLRTFDALMSVRVVAVIPAYEAEAHIGTTIEGVLAYVDQVVVVNDGSSDGTASEARKQLRTTVVDQGRQGPGAAVHTGLSWARRAGATYAVVVDADGQMDQSKIPNLITLLDSDGADLVRGSRLSPSSGGDAMPWVRHVAARALRLPATWGARQPIVDPLSGFIALRLTFLPDQLWPGFGYPMHLAAAVTARGGRIEHVPVPARYPVGGTSHHGLHRLPSILGAVKAAVRERFR